jgi:hypothetical protein
VADSDLVTFQIRIGLRPREDGSGIVHRPLDGRDVPRGVLVLGQLRNRVLPVAPARCADQLSTARRAVAPAG